MAERQGVPAIGVMTTRFASAAELMCRVLGMPDYKFVVIDHPISSASVSNSFTIPLSLADSNWFRRSSRCCTCLLV